MRVTKVRNLWVGWSGGILTIEIRQSVKEVHRYRLQRIPKALYFDMLKRPDPEKIMNDLLTMYLREDSQ